MRLSVVEHSLDPRSGEQSRFSMASTSESGMELESMDSARRHALEQTLSSLRTIVFPMVKPDPDFSPILQIYDNWEGRDEEAEEDEGCDQMRLILADGIHLQRALLGRELMNTMDVQQIKRGSLVRTTNYTLHPTVNYWEKIKRLIKIHDMESMANFLPIRESLEFFTRPDDDVNEWHEPEDWAESYWDAPDPWEDEEDSFSFYWDDPSLDPFFIGRAANAA